MKLTILELRSLIKEAMVTAEQAVSQNIALYSSESGNSIWFMLYDSHVIAGSYHMFAPSEPVKNMLLSAIYGVMWLEFNHDFDAYEVHLSKADHGYGPLLYDIAMSTGLSLIPDQNSITPDAMNIWKNYMSRKDIKKTPIISDREEPWMNVKISGATVNTNALRAKHNITKKKIESIVASRNGTVDFNQTLNKIAMSTTI
jgi:hypothetical protein